MPKDPTSEFSDEPATIVAGGDGQGAVGAAAGKTWFGHPRGLATLFFTEMWERFSYYGMRALLVLFMTAAVVGTNPGLGLDVGTAAAIYGLYTAMVYLLALPGGWIADNLWGQRKSVFVGGCIIAAGHFSMAVPTTPTFFLGLILIVLGTGLLKPNISAMVGDLYPEGGARRDAGFSVFYMGINLGSLLGITFCGLAGEGLNWHFGFSLAGFGMLLGLVQYKVGGKYLGTAGFLQSDEGSDVLRRRTRNFYLTSGVVAAAVVLLGFLVAGGVLDVTLEEIARILGYGIIILAVGYFFYLWFAGNLNRVEKKNLIAIFWFFILAAVFWSGFEQAGSSMNLFARDLTDRTFFGWEMPASWLLDVNPICIIIFAPLFGVLWTWLSTRNANPNTPLKFAFGLLWLAAGFYVLYWGSQNASIANKVSPAWLVVTYVFHTWGELCLSPVGLSSMTKLAPRGRVSQMMGIWFIGAALGNLFAGLVAGRLENLSPDQLFLNVTMYIGGAGVVALILSPFVKKLMVRAD